MRKIKLRKRDVAVMAMCFFLLLVNLFAFEHRGRQHAKNVFCQSNLKASSDVAIVYAEDHDGRFFSYGAGLWIDEFCDYTGDNDRVRICPMTKMGEDAASFGSSLEAWCWTSGLAEPEHGSYGFNGWLFYYDPVLITSGTFYWIETSLEDYAFMNYANISSPTTVPVFVDCVWVDLWPKDTDTVPSYFDLTQEIPNVGTDGPVNNHLRRAIIDRHFGTCNTGFADGHVEPVKLGRLWGLKWSKVFEIYDGVMTRIDGTPIY